MQIHNPILTGSFTVNGVDVSSITGSSSSSASFASQIASLNAASASILAQTASLNAFSSSLLSYTSSNDAKVSSLNLFSSSILSYTSSTDAKIASIYTTTGSQNTRLGALEAATASLYTATSSLNAFSASILTYTSSINASVASLNSYTQSTDAKIVSIYSTTSSLNASVAGLNAQTASLLSYTSSNDAKIASIYSTTSSLNTRVGTLEAYTASLNNKTSSFATTGSNTFVGTQTITGSVLQSGSFTSTGTLTAQTLVVQTITSSVDFVTGSTRFGTLLANTHQFTGSVSITGSTHSIYGNVGIGTTNPSQKLSLGSPLGIAGTATTYGSNDQGSIMWSYEYTGIYPRHLDIISAGSPDGTNGGGNIRFFTNPVTNAANSVERMRITSDGNVGIGTTTPSEKLSITSGNIQISAGYKLQYSSTAFMTPEDNTNGARIVTPGALNIATGGTSVKMTVDGSGNVGIGTTSPLTKLQVNGSISAEYSDSIYLDYSPSVGSYKKGFSGLHQSSSVARGLHIFNYDADSNGGINFWVGTNAARTQAAIITSVGNVGIGTTSPGYKLDVNGGATDTSLIVQNTGQNAVRLRLVNEERSFIITNNPADDLLSFSYDSSNRLQFNTTNQWFNSGNVGIGTTAPSQLLTVWGGNVYLRAGDPKVILNTIASAANLSNILIQRNDSTQYGIGLNSSDSFTIFASDLSSQRFVINSSGNVGIGTTSPASKLHVAGAGNAAGGNILMGQVNDSTSKWSYLVSTQYNSSTQPQGFTLIGGYTDATSNQVVIGGSIYEANPSTEIQFWTHTAVSHSTGGTRKMTIVSNGNVGIGSATPAYTLDVVGSIYASLALKSNYRLELPAMTIGYWDSTYNRFEGSSRPMLFTSYGSGNDINFGFDGGGGTLVLKQATGYVGIGTTSPAYKLDVSGTVRIGNVGRLYMNQLLPLGIVFRNDELTDGDGSNATVSDTTATNGDAKRRLSSASSNTFFYGPYQTIPAGTYIAYFRLKVASNASASQILTLDITNVTSAGSIPILPNAFAASNRYQYFKINFTVTDPTLQLEFRGLSFVTGITDLYLDHIMILPGS